MVEGNPSIRVLVTLKEFTFDPPSAFAFSIGNFAIASKKSSPSESNRTSISTSTSYATPFIIRAWNSTFSSHIILPTTPEMSSSSHDPVPYSPISTVPDPDLFPRVLSPFGKRIIPSVSSTREPELFSIKQQELETTNNSIKNIVNFLVITGIDMFFPLDIILCLPWCSFMNVSGMNLLS